LRDLARAHVFVFRQQRDHGEGNGIAEQTTQPRLSITHLFHGSDTYHVFAIAKTWQMSVIGRRRSLGVPTVKTLDFCFSRTD
jgi:hypothetical protein